MQHGAEHGSGMYTLIRWKRDALYGRGESLDSYTCRSFPGYAPAPTLGTQTLLFLKDVLTLRAELIVHLLLTS